MNIDAELPRLATEALSDDPRTALVACRRLGEELTWLEERAVFNARRADYPWQAIAQLLTLTRQSVHRRFRHVDQAPVRRPARDTSWGVADERAFHRIERDRRLADELRAWERSGDEIVPW